MKAIEVRLQRLEALSMATVTAGATLTDWRAYFAGTMTAADFEAKLSPDDCARRRATWFLVAEVMETFGTEGIPDRCEN